MSLHSTSKMILFDTLGGTPLVAIHRQAPISFLLTFVRGSTSPSQTIAGDVHVEECVHLFIESEEKNEEICLEIIKIFSFRVSIGSFFFSCDKLRQNKQQQCRHFSYVIFFLSFFFRQLSIHHPRCNYAKKKKKWNMVH